MTVTPAQLTLLAQAERGRVQSAKAAARVIHEIDRGAPRSAGQLSALLKTHGLTLSEPAVRRLRYIARLLHTLDPTEMNPPALAEFQDTETLYQLQRAAEVTHTGPDVLLARLQASKPESPREWLAAMTKARSASATPETEKAWKQALPRVPGSVSSDINKAFGAWCKALGHTPLAGMQALIALLDQERTLGLTGKAADRSALNAAFLEWAGHMNLTPARAAAGLVVLLEGLPPKDWRTLLTIALAEPAEKTEA